MSQLPTVALVLALVLMCLQGFNVPSGGKVTWWALSLAALILWLLLGAL